MARKMESVFLSKGVPVVPSIGTLLPVCLGKLCSYLNMRAISNAGNNDIWRELAIRVHRSV